MTTGELKKDKVREEYYDKVDDNSAVKPGDIILFDGHVGIVESYSPKEGTGKFFGSQSSTGPASTNFGPGTKDGWNKSYKILKPKPQYCPKTSSLENDDSTSDKASLGDPGKPIAHALDALGVASKNVYLTSTAAGSENSTPESLDIRDKDTSEKIGSCVMTPTGCEMTSGDRKVVMDKISGNDVSVETYAQNDKGDLKLKKTVRIGDNDGITVTRPWTDHASLTIGTQSTSATGASLWRANREATTVAARTCACCRTVIKAR